MVLVLALLLTALCGIHSASIPANSLGKLAKKSANKLDMPKLDKIRHTVLEDMKRLLDNQLAVLLDSPVDQKAGAQRKLLKPKTKLHPTLSTGDTTSNLESLLPDEPQNSDLIKVLTDGSLQDSGDEVLRNTVDQLLQEDEDKTSDNIDSHETLLYKNEDQLSGENSTRKNSGEIIDEDAYDESTLSPINTNDKDRQKGKSNSRKGMRHVIIEHLPKTNKKYDDDKSSENILDLDEILKSALKDISSSLSHEDEYSKADNEDRDLPTENLYPPKSNQQNESSFQVEDINNEDFDETTLKIENDNNDLGRNNDNGELETRSNSVIEHDPKTKHYKHTHKYSRNHKDHQPIKNYNDSSESHANKRYEIHREEKDENDTKELKRGENEDEVRIHHNQRQNSNEKSKKIYKNRRSHHNKNHHGKHRHNKSHDTHKHQNENKNHDHAANQHITIRLISDSDGSNESRLDSLHNKKSTHGKKLERNDRHQNSKETSNQSDRYDLPTLREDTVNVSQDTSEDKSNLDDIKKPDGNKQKNNSFEPNNNFSKEHESISDETDENIQGKKLTKEESNEIDDVKQVSREENKILETRKGKKENNIKNEDDISKEGNENDNYVTDEIENTENKAGDETSGIEGKTRNLDENDNEDKKVNIIKDEKSKKDEIHQCHHERDERIGVESGNPNVIRDLIQNKEMKKSYSLTLTLSTK